jgi:hypothetical protein
MAGPVRSHLSRSWSDDDMLRRSPPLTMGAPSRRRWHAKDGHKIGRITRDGGSRDVALPTPKSQPRGLAIGPENNLWCAAQAGNKSGRLHIL